MSSKVSEFLNGDIISKHSKLVSNELEPSQDKRKSMSLISAIPGFCL